MIIKNIEPLPTTVLSAPETLQKAAILPTGSYLVRKANSLLKVKIIV